MKRVGFPQVTRDKQGAQQHLVVFVSHRERKVYCCAPVQCGRTQRFDMDQDKPLACPVCQAEHERLCRFWEKVAADQETAERKRIADVEEP